MRILNRYISRDFIRSFALTLLVFTFVMCVGALIKAIDLLARGVSGWLILKMFFYNVPFIMTFSIPMSVLTTVLLLVGRLSYDGEITAMKACGLSVWQVAAPIIMWSIVMSFVCIYLSSTAAPNSHYAQRRVLVELGMEDPVTLLEEGRFVRDFPGLMVYIGKKDRNRVTDISVYEIEKLRVVRHIRARAGTINVNRERNLLEIDLDDVRIDQPDRAYPLDLTKSRHLTAERYPVKIDFSQLLRRGSVNKKIPDMTFGELIGAIRNVRAAFPNVKEEEVLRQRMALLVDANERLALSLSCFAFALLGIPLGMRSRRKETSVGVAINLALVFLFYVFILLADSLVDRPELRPDLIVWTPVILAEIIGFWLIQRSN